VNAGALELAAKRLGPRLEERLGPRVNREQGRRNQRSERSNRQDQAALALDHAGQDKLGDLERGVAAVSQPFGSAKPRRTKAPPGARQAGNSHVDLDDVGDVLVRHVLVELGRVVRLPNVVDWGMTKVGGFGSARHFAHSRLS